jgi:hypothetical protein
MFCPSGGVNDAVINRFVIGGGTNFKFNDSGLPARVQVPNKEFTVRTMMDRAGRGYPHRENMHCKAVTAVSAFTNGALHIYFYLC